jgi:hypothetical protein
MLGVWTVPTDHFICRETHQNGTTDSPLWEEIPGPRPGNREHQLQELVFTMSDAWSASPGQGTVCTPVRSTGYRLNVYITQNYSSM